MGSEGRVTVFTPTPLATEVAPGVGPAAGGTEVTVTGVNFVNVRGVTFGSTPAASTTVVSPTTIRATSPPGAPGSVHVRVTNSYGTSPELPGGFGAPTTRFTYVAAPMITGVSPRFGAADRRNAGDDHRRRSVLRERRPVRGHSRRIVRSQVVYRDHGSLLPARIGRHGRCRRCAPPIRHVGAE